MQGFPVTNLKRPGLDQFEVVDVGEVLMVSKPLANLVKGRLVRLLVVDLKKRCYF
mgnify:CR=1 FL=1